MKLSDHFWRQEFHCTGCSPQSPCARGGWDTVDSGLLMVLETVRRHFDAPMRVNSGHRCPERNAAVGGAPRSQHLVGRAADIVVDGMSPASVYAFLDPWHRGGLGLYRSFVHIDTRSDGPARWDRTESD